MFRQFWCISQSVSNKLTESLTGNIWACQWPRLSDWQRLSWFQVCGVEKLHCGKIKPPVRACFYCQTPCIVMSTHTCTYMYYFITRLAFISVHTASNDGWQSGTRCYSISPWVVVHALIQYISLNPLMTKRRLLYLKTQFVPRSKHFSSRL